MSWKERVASLPVTLPQAVPADNECVEESIGNVHLIATHSFMPGVGNMLVFSLSGPRQDLREFIRLLDKEMGPPAAESQLPKGVKIRSFKSPVDTLPTTDVHTKVGMARINEICAEHDLNQAETRIMHEVLVGLFVFADNQPERLSMLQSYLGRCSPERCRKVIDALAAVRSALDVAS